MAPRDDKPSSLDALRQSAMHCDDCAFAVHATQTVWGEGAVGATLMLVGEQPGDREDLEGRPFVGPAGQLLRKAMQELGWPMERVYVTNAVKHFKFEWRGKRRMHKTPAQREAAACSRWLEGEIEQVRPEALVALGATAVRSLLGPKPKVLEAEGTWLTRTDGRRVLVVRHPSALLRADRAELPRLYESWKGLLDRATPLLRPR